MRALLCYGATERNGGRDEAREGLRECGRFARSNARPARARARRAARLVHGVRRDARGGGGAVPRARRRDPRPRGRGSRRRRRRERRGYAGPLERLLLRGALPPGSILAHGVHLDADQVRAAGRPGLWLVQNPRSNRGNGVGYRRGARGESARRARHRRLAFGHGRGVRGPGRDRARAGRRARRRARPRTDSSRARGWWRSGSRPRPRRATASSSIRRPGPARAWPASWSAAASWSTRAGSSPPISPRSAPGPREEARRVGTRMAALA